tara:strand:+ start:2535 stop:3650 length:1116 start_codon:yes stop_codon:yes gene_type:complete
MDINRNSDESQIDSSFFSHGGNLNQEATRLGINIDQIIDASASLVPFPHPKKLDNYLYKALKKNNVRNYPDRAHFELRKAIGSWHKIDPELVLPGNGAAELNTWAARDASITGMSGLPSPGFADYERALICWNAPYIQIPLPLSWSNHSPQPLKFDTNAEVIWLTNPHNPTGQLWSRESLEPLLIKHKLVICDEAFLPLVPDGEKQSLIPLAMKYPNLIVIRSLTKLFAIAGLRIGYAISSPNRLNNWRKLRDPWPLNSIAISATTMIMNDHITLLKWSKKIHNWINKEGYWLQSNLSFIPGLISHPSSTNFQLIQSQNSLLEVRERLAERKILLRDCLSFPRLGRSWLRISLQTRNNNKKIVQIIRDTLK